MAKTIAGKNLVSEHEIQASFFDWLDLHKAKHPVLNYFFAIPNGANKSPTARMKFRREGLKAGVPDVHLPVPSMDGKYIGLWFEFKSAGGKVSWDQEIWIKNLQEVGHRVEIARDWTDAADIVIDHCELPIKKFKDED